MRQPLDVQRKLRQLDNDVQSTYEMLTGIAGTQLRHGNRLHELAEQLDHHGERLDQIDVKLDSISGCSATADPLPHRARHRSR